jgi:RNA polymerase sigma factor (sigma-70 family)
MSHFDPCKTAFLPHADSDASVPGIEAVADRLYRQDSLVRGLARTARRHGCSSIDAEEFALDFRALLVVRLLRCGTFGFDPRRGTMDAFLAVCFRNYLLNHLKTRKGRSRRVGGHELVEDLSAPAKDLDVRLDLAAVFDRLGQGDGLNLTGEEREAFLHYYRDDWTLNQTAERMGIKFCRVRRLLDRALLKIRPALRPLVAP